MEATVKVALPGWMGAQRGPWSALLDVTALIEEWAVGLLDPVGELRSFAPKALEFPGWDLCGKATVSPATMRLVREAAGDAGVLEAVLQSHYAPLVRERLGPQATCLLLGLAGVTALSADLGVAASSIRAEVRKRQERAPADDLRQTSERARSEEAASQDVAAPRPVLSPLPPELSGPYHCRPRHTKASDPLEQK